MTTILSIGIQPKATILSIYLGGYRLGMRNQKLDVSWNQRMMRKWSRTGSHRKPPRNGAVCFVNGDPGGESCWDSLYV